MTNFVLLKQGLSEVKIEVIDKRTTEKITLGENIVFNASSKPNINCQDFGITDKKSRGTFNIDEGKYQFRLLMKHQVLESVDFEVK